MTAINFSNALGMHEQALHLRTVRSTVLAGNLANAETPGYKARDFDFHQALAAVQAGREALGIKNTHVRHISSKSPSSPVPLSYRLPLQPSLDGNTVDSHLESAAFARNALDFSASFRFLNSRFSGLSKAISGD